LSILQKRRVQVPQISNWRDIVTEDVTLVWDFDTPCFAAASAAEEKITKFTHKDTGEEFFKEKDSPVMERFCVNPETTVQGYVGKDWPKYDKRPTGKVENIRFKHKTEFWGGKKVIGGYLGDINTTREAKKEFPYTRGDFHMEESYGVGVMAHAINNLKGSVKRVEGYLGISRHIFLVGKGDCHRHLLDMPVDPKHLDNPLRGKYKGRRGESRRPELLDQVKDYAVSGLNARLIEGIEVDDEINFYGWESHLHYKKTGKHKYILLSIDKDQRGFNCLVFDFNKNPKTKDWIHPHPYLIDGLGSLRRKDGRVKGKVKGEGQLWALTQLLIGDLETDGFSPTRYLGIPYGDGKAFELLHDVTDVRDGFTKVCQQYADWFPEGVHFTSWSGKEVSMTWLQWANRIWTMLYMLKSREDKTTLTSILDKLGVDYHNIVPYVEPEPEPAPVPEFVGVIKAEQITKEIKEELDNILTSELKSFKSLKKGELVEKLEWIKDNLLATASMFDNLYEMKQEEK
jgi:hypothetical protein